MTRLLPLLLALLVLPALLAGCNLLQLTPTHSAIRTRIVGVTATPAEIAPGQSTDLTPVVVHAPGVTPDLGALWFACVTSGSAAGCLGVDPTSSDGFDPSDLQLGVGDTFTYTASGPSVEDAWAALEPAERIEGLTVLVSVNLVPRSNEELQQMLIDLGAAAANGDDAELDRLSDELQDLFDGAITAARRVVISDKADANPAPEPSCAVQELLANTNPSIAGVLLHLDEDGLDEGHELGPVTFVEPGTSLTLRPVLSDDAVEDYLFINRDDETECRQERPYFAWIVNGGGIADYSFVAEEGDLEEVAGLPKFVSFGLPDADEFPARLDLWLVLRDRRGGLAWTQRSFVALEP